MREDQGVGNVRLLGLHSRPRQETVAASQGAPLVVDLVTPVEKFGAILPDGEAYFEPRTQEVAQRNLRAYFRKIGRPGVQSVLHAHHWTSALAIQPAKEAGMATIFTPDTPGVLNLRTGRDCTGVRYAVERQAMLDTDIVTVNTDYERQIIGQVYSNTPSEASYLLKKTMVLPPGIETRIFNPEAADQRKTSVRAELGVPPSASLVVTAAGRLSEAKNFEAVIAGWGEHMARGTSINDFLVLITNLHNQNDPYLRRIRDAINTLPAHARERVLLRDFQHDPLVPYAACDIFITLSRLETYGSSLSEAMACGRPSIASDIYQYIEQLGLNSQSDTGYRQLVEPLVVSNVSNGQQVGVAVAKALAYSRKKLANPTDATQLRSTMIRLGQRRSWQEHTKALLELIVQHVR